MVRHSRAALLVLFHCLLLAGCCVAAQTTRAPVTRLTIDGAIGPANADYIQTMSVAALDAFLKSRGFGTDDTEPALRAALLTALAILAVALLLAVRDLRLDRHRGLA